MFDIAIVGLGPAGAIFASMLDKSYKVIAIDKKLDGAFSKPCGGLLAPDAQKALTSFGLNLPKDILCDPQIFSVKTIDLDNDLIQHYQRMYINLDRNKFDMWLIDNIPERVEKRQGVVTSVVRREESYNITYNCDGTQTAIQARYVIGADGAKSMVRHLIKPKLKTREYLSIQQWFRDESPTPFYSCIFDSESTDCYSWTISKDGCLIFGGAYPIKSAKTAFEKQKGKLVARGIKLGEPIKTEGCLVLRPTGLGSFCLGKDGIFLAGEAAGFISPSSLEGISSAIISASALAEAFNGALSGKDVMKTYRSLTRRLRIKLTLKLIKCPFMYDRRLRKMVMKSGLQAIDMKSI